MHGGILDFVYIKEIKKSEIYPGGDVTGKFFSSQNKKKSNGKFRNTYRDVS